MHKSPKINSLAQLKVNAHTNTHCNAFNKAVKPTHTASLALQWLRHFIAKLSTPVWLAYCERYKHWNMKILFGIGIILLSGNTIGGELNSCPDNLEKKMGELPKYPSHTGKPVEGWVKIRAVLSPEGKLQEIEVVESEPQGWFEKSAIESLKTWEFNWEGSSCIYTKTITFELAE